MPDFIDLLNEIAGKETENLAAPTKQGKFRTSVMTTYTAYLPFYENVVLRRLLASGCRYNVLLVDSRDLAYSLQDSTRMPRLAGRNYVLAPMQAKRAFHPKILMLLGEHNARILVGSHNTTLCGFGYNRELTTRIDLDRGFKGEHRGFFQEAWKTLEEWTNFQRDYLPSKLVNAILRIGIERHPWLRGNDGQGADTLFLSSFPEGESLWEKTRVYLPETVENIIILGPFFDKEGEFIKRLYEDLKPLRIAIGLDTHSENIRLCKQEGLPSEVSFHEVSDLIKGSMKQRQQKPGYLHAKAIFFDAPGEQSVLLTGSANPSSPAWLGSSDKRNAEAVVVHRGKEARKVAEALELLQIPSLPAIKSSEMERLYVKTTEQSGSSSTSSKRQLVAEIIEEGILIPFGSISREDVANCCVFFENQKFLDDVPLYELKNGLLIKVEEKTEFVTRLVLTLSDGTTYHLFIHNPVAVSKLSVTSRQQKFQDALDSLDTDSPDFQTLFRITSELIFDNPNKEEAETKGTKKVAPDQSKTKEEASIGPLSVSIKETKHQQRRRRELHHSDLAFVIDALIYNLGVGLNNAAEKIGDQGLSEEEQIGQEDESSLSYASENKKDSLLKICHGKIGTLVNRMCRRLNDVEADTPQVIKVVDQLLAILAVLREVRANDLKLQHVIGEDTLVPFKERKKLLEASLKALFGDKKNLFGMTAQLFKEDPENDMAPLLGLIIWLTWDCGVNVRNLRSIPIYEHEARREALLELSKLFAIAIRAGNFEKAFKEAKHSAWRVCQEEARREMMNWMQSYEQWAKKIAKLSTLHLDSLPWVRAESGRVGIALKEKKPKMRVILSDCNKNVHLAEFGRANDEIVFERSTVKAIPLPTLKA